MSHKSPRRVESCRGMMHGKRVKTREKEKSKPLRIGGNEIVEHRVTVVETPAQKLQRYRREQLMSAVNKTVDEMLNGFDSLSTDKLQWTDRKEGGDAQQ